MQRSIDEHANHSKSQFVYLQEQITYLFDRFGHSSQKREVVLA